jgi:hypothetical protein
MKKLKKWCKLESPLAKSLNKSLKEDIDIDNDQPCQSAPTPI